MAPQREQGYLVLTLAKIEGDAVLAYAPAGRLKRRETLLEVLEGSYVAFRERVERLARNSTCQACRTVDGRSGMAAIK